MYDYKWKNAQRKKSINLLNTDGKRHSASATTPHVQDYTVIHTQNLGNTPLFISCPISQSKNVPILMCLI